MPGVSAKRLSAEPNIRVSGGVRLSTGRWRVDARVPVTALQTALGTELPSGDWNTVGGLVLALIGRIPRAGEQLQVAGDLFVVTAASRRRVLEVEIRRNH